MQELLINYVLKKKCKKYIGIEPDYENFKCLELNNKIKDSVLLNTAVTMFDDEKIGFFTANSGNKLIGFVDRINGNTMGRSYVEVNNINFFELLDKYKPQVIKCDAEGIEFDLFSKGLPEYVEEVCMEVHIYNNEERLKTFWFQIMNGTFYSMGWKCVLLPIYDDREIKSYNGFNVFSIGWKRIPGWKNKRKINKFKSLKKCLIRNFGHTDYNKDSKINKYATNFLKNEFSFEDFDTYLAINS